MCAYERERESGQAAWLDVGIISGLLQDDQVGQENQDGSAGAHKAVRGRSSMKSLPPCHCDPPGWSSEQAVRRVCMVVLEWSENMGMIFSSHVEYISMSNA